MLIVGGYCHCNESTWVTPVILCSSVTDTCSHRLGFILPSLLEYSEQLVLGLDLTVSEWPQSLACTHFLLSSQDLQFAHTQFCVCMNPESAVGRAPSSLLPGLGPLTNGKIITATSKVHNLTEFSKFWVRVFTENFRIYRICFILFVIFHYDLLLSSH